MKSDEIKWPKGLKKTITRKQVLDILCYAEKPLTANDVFTRLSSQGENACLSTIYRILDAFTENDMVTKTTILDSDKNLFELSKNEHSHYAVCLGCHMMVPISHCPIKNQIPKVDDFEVTGHKVEIYGYCKKCRDSKYGNSN